MHEVSYYTISNILDTWESIRRVKDFATVVGTSLYQKLFEQCPESKVLFGFARDLDPRCDKVVKSKLFLFQAANFINMIDMTLNMLGPDIELLTEAMTDLGHKHATAYGVKAPMFPIIKACLIETLEEFLGRDVMTLEVKACWEEVVDGLTADMLAAYPESN